MQKSEDLISIHGFEAILFEKKSNTLEIHFMNFFNHNQYRFVSFKF